MWLSACGQFRCLCQYNTFSSTYNSHGLFRRRYETNIPNNSW